MLLKKRINHYIQFVALNVLYHLSTPFNKVNGFPVVVHLFSNKSQMTTKCGNNKKATHKLIGKCATKVHTTFLSLKLNGHTAP